MTGGRSLESPALVFEALNAEYLAAAGGRVFVSHGACPTGADAFAAEWVGRLGVWAVGVPFRADWDSCVWDCRPGHRVEKRPGDVVHPGFFSDYCPGAGPRRNARMVEAGADLMLAFPTPTSRGTWNAVRLAKATGIEVRVIWP
ncbi:SLOG family protein [Streptomyces sp. CB03911]|uniref:SLOG family protein n=1 Tax=Streptomyces sp. CB03911 TaxID=1804758 RepID=UPI002570E050|nr:SLOG family protein [Streptomyces sp. CB03911]